MRSLYGNSLGLPTIPVLQQIRMSHAICADRRCSCDLFAVCAAVTSPNSKIRKGNVRSLSPGSVAELNCQSSARKAAASWSPDNRSIGFFADGKMKQMDIGGGPAVIICDAPIGLVCGTAYATRV
jgi:hypothetical protein